jgi:hypothetical protein
MDAALFDLMCGTNEEDPWSKNERRTSCRREGKRTTRKDLNTLASTVIYEATILLKRMKTIRGGPKKRKGEPLVVAINKSGTSASPMTRHREGCAQQQRHLCSVQGCRG